ncbi:MAG: extracellular solute-binding protein [Chloroflexota bacterium]|nr:extracellular solute-binding protein [Chloroflexota bacterium]MDE2885361.1 extracellular solute-binding protein [Chloroflexota bacterium]
MDTARCRNMRGAGLAVMLLVGLVVVAAGCGSDDPTPTPAGAASTPTPALSEWDQLIADAQEEGRLVVIGSGGGGSRMELVWDRFTDEFGIQTVVQRGSAREHTDRLIAEQAAGRFTADVGTIGGGTGATRAAPAGIFEETDGWLFLPEVVDRSNWFNGQHHYADLDEKYLFNHSAAFAHTIEFHVNTDKVSQAEIDAIQSIDDFLAPRWRGEIVGLTPMEPGATTGYYELYLMGETDWLQTYVQDLDVGFFGDFRTVEDQFAQGVYSICILGCGDIEDLADLGLPVETVRKDLGTVGTMVGGTSANVVHVMKDPANPNAAKLFVNWFLSREGQTAVHDLVAEYSGRTSPNSLRLDVPKDNVDPAEIQEPGRDYVNIDAAEHVAKRDEIIAQVREWFQAAN